MERFTNEAIIKERLLNFVNRKYRNEQKQIKFLKDCIINSGYVKEQPISQENVNEDEFSEYERLRLNPVQNRYQEFYDYDIDLAQGDIVNYASSIESGIDQIRLQKTQTYGITHEEQTLGIVNGLYENALSQLGIDNVIIKNQALNTYRQLLEYYRTNNLGLKINMGRVKKGYFGMILFYTLINNGIIVNKNVLTNLLNINLSDLPEAEKNIKLIFADRPKLFSSNIYELNLCNLSLPKDVTELIYDVINSMKKTFGDPLNQSQIAACIYYVCKIKGKAKITYKMLSENCSGNPTAKTIKSSVDLIVSILGG